MMKTHSTKKWTATKNRSMKITWKEKERSNKRKQFFLQKTHSAEKQNLTARFKKIKLDVGKKVKNFYGYLANPLLSPPLLAALP